MSLSEALVGGLFRDVIGEGALWGGSLLLVVAVLSFYHGWKRRKLSSRLAETPRTDIGAIASPGVVRVRGTIHTAPDADPFRPPFEGGRECVLSAWEIEEMYDTVKNRNWEPAAWGVRSVPFCIEDSSGRLRIEIEDRTVGNETEEVFTPGRLLVSDGVAIDGLQCELDSFDVHVETDYEETPPRRIREFTAATDGVSADPMTTGLVVDASKRRYREGWLRPGDEVSVLGYASRRESTPKATGDEAYVLTDAEETTLYVSSKPFEEYSDGGGSVLFGVFAGVIGVGLLVAAYLL